MADRSPFEPDGKVPIPDITLASDFGCSILAGSVLAIQAFIVLSGLSSLAELPRSKREGRLRLAIISFIILVASAINTGLRVRYYYLKLLYPWVSDMSTHDKALLLVADVMLVITIAVGDGLMIWRCLVLYRNKKWVIALPIVFLTGCVSCFIGYMVTVHDPFSCHKIITASAFLSVACNITVTTLMMYRLRSARKSAFNALPGSIQVYSRVASIIVESAAPLAIFGICFAITALACVNVMHKPPFTLHIARLHSVHDVFGWLYYSFCALSPQMVIYRVFTGTTSQDSLEVHSGVGESSHPILFAHPSVKETDSWSMTDRGHEKD